MSISIELKFYRKDELLKRLEEWGATDKELTVAILEACGSFIGDTYILLNNEHWNDLNPYYGLSFLLDHAYKKAASEKDSIDIILDEDGEGVNAIDTEEIAEKLGINLNSEEKQGEQ